MHKDIFYHIASYFTLTDAINLSKCNHFYHKTLHKQSFVNALFFGKKSKLVLTQQGMTSIMDISVNPNCNGAANCYGYTKIGQLNILLLINITQTTTLTQLLVMK